MAMFRITSPDSEDSQRKVISTNALAPCWHSLTFKDAADIMAKGSMYRNVYINPEQFIQNDLLS